MNTSSKRFVSSSTYLFTPGKHRPSELPVENSPCCGGAQEQKSGGCCSSNGPTDLDQKTKTTNQNRSYACCQ